MFRISCFNVVQLFPSYRVIRKIKRWFDLNAERSFSQSNSREAEEQHDLELGEGRPEAPEASNAQVSLNHSDN